MSTEKCKLCKKLSTPWFYLDGHICQDCYLYRDRSHWISCKDLLPKENKEVMFYYVIYGNEFFSQQKDIIKRDIVCGHLANNIWHICYLFVSIPVNDKVVVTHWMDLPENPEDEKDIK